MNRRRTTTGVALVIVLTALVLLTVLIVAFVGTMRLDLISSKNYSDGIKAEELALGGIDWALADLLREIEAGSEVDPDDQKPGVKVDDTGTRIYPPRKVTIAGQITSPSMVPLKFVSNDERSNFPNLLRRSLREEFQSNYAPASFTSELYPDADDPSRTFSPAQASEVSTADAGTNGRRTNFAFWNAPLLMKPDGTEADQQSFRQPDWLLVTRRGIKAFKNDTSNVKMARDSKSDDFVVGRVAYVIYDVGGLLDANVVGNLLEPGENARRGWAHQTDVTRIPGLKITALKPNFVGWRWPASGDRIDPLERGSLFDPQRTFLQVSPLRKAGRSDNVFLNRGDLVRYTRESADLEERSLEFFTTFSRDLNAPTWSPSNPIALDLGVPDNATWYDYAKNAVLSRDEALSSVQMTNQPVPVTNRDLLRVRWPRDVAIKTWEGTDHQAKTGDPVFARRFPLSKLDLFRRYIEAHKASDTAEKQKLLKEIRYTFGLVPDTSPAGSSLSWDFSNDPRRWRYNVSEVLRQPGSTGANAVKYTRLLSLDQLAEENLLLDVDGHTHEPREPNFFEILQATILSGELGLGMELKGDLTNRAAQTLAIGANIIDQYDEDNYPTLIRTYAPNQTSFQNRTIQRGKVLAGAENIPFLSEAMFQLFRPEGGPNRNAVRAWMNFEVWNPHSNAGATETFAVGPREFRIVATGGTSIVNVGGNNPNQAAPDPVGTPSIQPDFGAAFQNNEEGTPYQIRFTYAENQVFGEPTLLKTSNVIAPHADNVARSGAVETVGIFLGETEAILPNPLGNYSTSTLRNPAASAGNTSRPLSFELQFRSESGLWTTYQVWEYMRTQGASGAYNDTSLESQTFTPGYPTNHRVGNVSFGAFPYFMRAFSVPDVRVSSESVNPMSQYFGGQATPGQSLLPLPTGTQPSFYDYLIGFAGVYATTSSGSSTGFLRVKEQVNNRCSPGYMWVNLPIGANKKVAAFGRDRILRPTDYTHLSPAIWPSLPNGSATRPFHLNRPFRSVAELGYVFRDSAARSINLSDSASAELGIADAFSMQEVSVQYPIRAGAFNLNAARKETLTAYLSGAQRKGVNGSARFAPQDADMLATKIINAIHDPALGPILHRSYLGPRIKSVYSGSELQSLTKEEIEAALQPLGDVGQTRTWNLMIDVVAQVGRYAPNATDLRMFTINGERRYWVHVAIDRMTGKVIDQSVESIQE